MKQLRYSIELNGLPTVGEKPIGLTAKGVVDIKPGVNPSVLLALEAVAQHCAATAKPELREVTGARIAVTWVNVPEKPPTSNLEH